MLTVMFMHLRRYRLTVICIGFVTNVNHYFLVSLALCSSTRLLSNCTLDGDRLTKVILLVNKLISHWELGAGRVGVIVLPRPRTLLL